MPNVEIRVDGLADLRRALNRMENLEAASDLRHGLKRAADEVAQEAKGHVPVRSGAARDSLRATSGGNRAYVVGGRAKVPYYGWLDFGGRIGRDKAVRRPFVQGGRYMYPAYSANASGIQNALADALVELATSNGLEVQRG